MKGYLKPESPGDTDEKVELNIWRYSRTKSQGQMDTSVVHPEV